MIKFKKFVLKYKRIKSYVAYLTFFGNISCVNGVLEFLTYLMTHNQVNFSQGQTLWYQFLKKREEN